MAVLENASVPVVDGNTRRGQLRADSLYILADGASLAAFEVQLVLAAGRDSLLVQAAEARMRVGSGAVDLERFRFTTRGGRQVSADRGTFDGENSIRMTLPVRIDGSPKEATGAALTYRVDTGELAGCRSGCE